MKNGDMPAMPGHEYGRDGNLAAGLTKREHFAGLAMQGLLASDGNGGAWFPDIEVAAEKATQYADALLAELEKTP